MKLASPLVTQCRLDARAYQCSRQAFPRAFTMAGIIVVDLQMLVLVVWPLMGWDGAKAALSESDLQ